MCVSRYGRSVWSCVWEATPPIWNHGEENQKELPYPEQVWTSEIQILEEQWTVVQKGIISNQEISQAAWTDSRSIRGKEDWHCPRGTNDGTGGTSEDSWF